MNYKGSIKKIDAASFVIDITKRELIKNRYGKCLEKDLDDSVIIFLEQCKNTWFSKETIALLLVGKSRELSFSHQELKVMFELAKEERINLFNSLCYYQLNAILH